MRVASPSPFRTLTPLGPDPRHGPAPAHFRSASLREEKRDNPQPPSLPSEREIRAASRSKTRKVLAGAALGLVGLTALPLGIMLAPHSQIAYQCLNGTTVRADVPNLVESILDGPGLSPKARAILQCQGAASAGDVSHPQYRAELAWEGMIQRMGGSPADLRESASASRATVWPYGQAMAAALDLAKLTGDYSPFEAMVSQLEAYRSPDGGYFPSLQGGDRYFDDNAWLGLVFMQAHYQRAEHSSEYLEKARSIFSFLETGMTSQGGILWKEKAERPSYNTCALGPTIELAVHLFRATGQPEYLQQALRLDQFMDAHLRLPSGLYADNIGLELKDPDPSLYSYNQGTPVGAKLLLYQVTGDEQALQKAQQTAQAALDHYSQGDRLWQHSPAFNAVFFRNLLKIPQHSPVRALMETYLERAWQSGLDSSSALFEKQAGQGSYESGHGLQMIDQAGLIQLLALQAWNPADLAMVT